LPDFFFLLLPLLLLLLLLFLLGQLIIVLLLMLWLRFLNVSISHLDITLLILRITRHG